MHYTRETLKDTITQDDIEVNVYRTSYYHDGSCQCFKDCDCYKDKGKLMSKSTLYITKEIDDLNRHYRKCPSIKAAIQQMNTVKALTKPTYIELTQKR